MIIISCDDSFCHTVEYPKSPLPRFVRHHHRAISLPQSTYFHRQMIRGTYRVRAVRNTKRWETKFGVSLFYLFTAFENFSNKVHTTSTLPSVRALSFHLLYLVPYHPPRSSHLSFGRVSQLKGEVGEQELKKSKGRH